MCRWRRWRWRRPACLPAFWPRRPAPWPAIRWAYSNAGAPFAILPIYVALEKIDRSLLEAGRDLGESRAMTFWRVTLPLAMPGVLAAVLITWFAGYVVYRLVTDES